MSSPASERPVKKLTNQPFAKLSPPEARRTGPRPKTADTAQPQAPLDPDDFTRPEPAEPAVTSAATTSHSERPDSLRKPFASLPVQKPSALPEKVGTPAVAPGAPPPTWDDASSRSSVGASRSRPNSAVCRTHGLAKNRAGQCMRCEQERKKAERSWLLPAVAMALCVLLGVALAALI